MGRTSRLAVTTSLLVLGVGIWTASRFSAGTAVESEGQRIFRFDTFGDEQFWTDTAKMEQVVQRSVSPSLAAQDSKEGRAHGEPPPGRAGGPRRGGAKEGPPPPRPGGGGGAGGAGPGPLQPPPLGGGDSD